MTLDHVNKHLFNAKLPYAFELGRLAMPLFAFVLAYNLARPNALPNGLYVRTMKRLALFGMAASPFFIALGGLAWGWYPLNIMFTLLVATATLYFSAQGNHWGAGLATVAFLVGGGIVEFWWFGLAFCIGAWRYCKNPGTATLVFWILAATSLYLVNQNLWALLSLPIIFVASKVHIATPRIRHVFYIYYPVHLAILLLIVFVSDPT